VRVNGIDPPIDEDRARELLRGERERIESSLADSDRMRGSEVDEIDTDSDLTGDASTIDAEEVDDALTAQLRAELEAVERAEQRLAEGTYGFSVESGAPIPAERLEAIPWAERTAAEQEHFERTHGRAL
jgi:RNA polymerase-binding transcription factor